MILRNRFYGGYLMRYTPDGKLDKTFGSGGRTALFDSDYVNALAIDSQDRIIVGGTGACFTNGSYCQAWNLARYRPNGSLDKTFGGGGNGYASVEMTIDSSLRDLAIDPAGNIVVAGTDYNGEELARFKPNGSIDPSLGSEGIAMIPDGIFPQSIAIDSAGRIVISDGSSLQRVDAGGDVDGGFGSGGIAAAGSNNAYDVAIEPTGRIVTAGHDGTNYDFALAALDPSGSLDPTFGSGGQVTTSFAGVHSDASDLAIDSAARIVAVGSAGSGERNSDYGPLAGFAYGSRFALARYTPGGALDSTFGSGGKVTTASFPPDTAITNATIQSQQRTARFRFAGVGERSGFKCRLVSKSRPNPSFNPCSAPKVYSSLPSGSYTFQGRAVGSLGPDSTPAQQAFTIN